VIKAESDYHPWGGELQFVNNDSNDYKFTGKKRDLETGLDYFGARYYSNGLGRFITPDWSAVPVPVPYADLGDPQTLNQYSYVRNIPTVKVDADGHDPQDVVAKVVQVVSTTSEEVPVAIEPVIPSLGVLGPLLGGAVFMRADPNDPVMKAMSAVMARQNQQTQTQTQNGQSQETEHTPEPAPASAAPPMKGSGRGGKQDRLKELGKDDKVSSADRGEIKRDQNQIARGTRSTIRVPGNKNLAHRRGKEARKGYDYKHSDLQNKDLHRLQHKHEGYK
jgi:RHS repeat-associated protein